MHLAKGPATIADEIANIQMNFSYDNNDIASCGIAVMEDGTSGVVENDQNHGVITFGWNKQPVAFDGRIGGWVDGSST